MGSKLISFFIRNFFDEVNDAFPQIKVSQLKSLPIKEINLTNSEDKQLHDEIVKLVDTMLALNKEKQQTTLPEKLESLQHRIQYTDAKINQLVYRLYGLTDEEIALVEKS